MKRTILQNTLVTLGSFIFVITVLNAWTGPSTTPPDPNVSAPLTISATSQSKVGGLDVGWLSSVGAVKVGYTTTACTADIAGSLRWNTGVMEYCNGTVWGPFVGSGSSGGGGNDSPYCAFSGQTKPVNVYVADKTVGWDAEGTVGTCTMSVDATGYQTISVSYTSTQGYMGEYGWAGPVASSWSKSLNNQDTISENPVISVQFNRSTGVLNCTLTHGGLQNIGTYTFTKDQSKCASSGAVAETDPTVPTSVKDGVSWAEVTGKPTINSVPSGYSVVFSQTNSGNPGVGVCPPGWTWSGYVTGGSYEASMSSWGCIAP
jgi:hypothetical protein